MFMLRLRHTLRPPPVSLFLSRAAAWRIIPAILRPSGA
jgi:hypothetical protein